MLHIIFGELEYFNKRFNTDYRLWIGNSIFFDSEYDLDWINTDWSKWVIKEIDKSTYIVDHIIDSPFLGKIPPTWISGGAKMLITMCNYNIYEGSPIIFNGDSMGENCAEALTKLSMLNKPEEELNENLSNDIWMNLTYGMTFPRTDQPVDVIFEGLNWRVNTTSEDLEDIMLEVYCEWNVYIDKVLKQEGYDL